MVFTEKDKREVKERAGFQCCICQKFLVQVHHIIPLKDGGTDDIDNAAPLCANCHYDYGDNPIKRKEIRQIRDWWYGIIEKRYSSGFIKAEMLSNIDTKLEDIRNQSESGFSELKQMLTSLSTNFIKNMKPENAVNIATGLVKGIYLTGSTFKKEGPTGSTFKTVKTNITCKYCGSWVGILIGSTKCPNCGRPIK